MSLPSSRAEAQEPLPARAASTVPPQILVNSVAMGLGIVRECDAVFPATAESLAEDLAAGRLVALDFDAPALRPSAFVFHLRDRTLSPAARAFLEKVAPWKRRCWRRRRQLSGRRSVR